MVVSMPEKPSEEQNDDERRLVGNERKVSGNVMIRDHPELMLAAAMARSSVPLVKDMWPNMLLKGNSNDALIAPVCWRSPL